MVGFLGSNLSKHPTYSEGVDIDLNLSESIELAHFEHKCEDVDVDWTMAGMNGLCNQVDVGSNDQCLAMSRHAKHAAHHRSQVGAQHNAPKALINSTATLLCPTSQSIS